MTTIKATTKTLLVLSTCLLATVACSPGEGTIGGVADTADAAPDAAPPPTAYLLTVAPRDPTTEELQLGTQTLYDVTVMSINQYAGEVALAATDIPETWDVTIEPATVSLSAGESATAVMTVDIPEDAIIAGDGLSATPVALSVAGAATPAADQGDKGSEMSLMTRNLMKIAIADGTGTAPEAHQFPPTTTIRLGTRLSFANKDQTRHAIHANAGTKGFPHQSDNGMGQGESYDVSITEAGSYTYYCHGHQEEEKDLRYTITVVR